MRIKINDIDRTPFWGIPEAKIHLSSESNEFIEVDPDILTPYQQQTLWTALKMKTILADDDSQFQEDFKAMLKGYLEKRQKTHNQELKQVFGIESTVESKQAVENVKRAEELKQLAEHSVSTLKRLLPELPAADLEVFYKIESLGKGRKSVLKLIDSLISKQTKAIANRVENKNAPSASEYESRQVFKGKDRHFLPNISNVRESDIEEVSIKVGED